MNTTSDKICGHTCGCTSAEECYSVPENSAHGKVLSDADQIEILHRAITGQKMQPLQSEVSGSVPEKSDNELIAEFMGLHVRMINEVHYLSDDDGYVDLTEGGPYWPDMSWDQLMPVVEKIESMGYRCKIDGYCFNIDMPDGGSIYGSCLDSKIESVHDGVVEFIKWYKQQ